MKLEQASRYADSILKWLGPHCHRIEIVGSVRRERPECGDIDVLCIPKLIAAPTDLLGHPDGEPTSLVREFLVHHVKTAAEVLQEFVGEGKKTTRPTRWRSGSVPQPDAEIFLLKLPKCELDVYAANERTFITRLISRTGSKEHNIWIAQRAERMGLHWDPAKGLMPLDLKLADAPDTPVYLTHKTEEEFYKALDLPLIFPAEREGEALRRKFDLTIKTKD